jgi:ferredoxin-type protein NapF
MMCMDASRRGFLLGRRRPAFSPAVSVLRPPGALPEAAFLTACTRCAKCVEKCPTGIVVMRDGELPQIDFSAGECTFCGECIAACTDGALRRDAGQVCPPLTLRAHIGSACLAQRNEVCRLCGDRCAARAIRFRPQLGGAALPEVTAAQCTGCGACVAVCPTQAVVMHPDSAPPDRCSLVLV